MAHELLTVRYRDLFVNRIDTSNFVIFDYALRAASNLDVAEAALRSLLILTRRSLYNIRNHPDDADPRRLGAIQSSSALKGDRADVKIALPLGLFPEDDPFTTIVLLGSSIAEYSYCQDVWLKDVDLPDALMNCLSGPRYGVDGIRKALQIFGRPLLAAVVPVYYLGSSVELKRYVESAFQGGADLIVDDILTVPTATKLESHIGVIQDVVMAVNAKRTHQESRVGYFVNCTVSGRVQEDVLRYARRTGALGLIVNCYTMSYGWVAGIAREGLGEGYFPVLVATNMGSSMLGRNPLEERTADSQPGLGGGGTRTGISELVTAKLSRLAGADAVHTGTAGAECWHPAEFNMTPRTLGEALGRLPRAMCVAEGDMRISEIGANVRYLGPDTILEVSSGMFSDPRTVTATARAYRKLCEVVSARASDPEYEVLLLALAAKHSYVCNVLEREGWQPTRVPADFRDPRAFLRETAWFDQRRERQFDA